MHSYKTFSSTLLKGGNLRYSTLNSHIGGLYNKLVNMASSEKASYSSDYVTITTSADGKEEVQILEDGQVSADNINSMRFTFEASKNITNSIRDQEAQGITQKPAAVVEDHKTGYSAGRINYPDNKFTDVVYIKNVVIQYRETLERVSNTKYGSVYVCIGFPIYFINKLTKDAKQNSSLTLIAKPKYEVSDGHQWIDCNLGKLINNTVTIVGSEGQDYSRPLKDMLIKAKKSLLVDVLVTLSGSITTQNASEELNLKGTHHVTMAPKEMYLKGFSNVKGPQLTNTSNRAKTTVDFTSEMVASDEILRLAMGVA